MSKGISILIIEDEDHLRELLEYNLSLGVCPSNMIRHTFSGLGVMDVRAQETIAQPV